MRFLLPDQRGSSLALRDSLRTDCQPAVRHLAALLNIEICYVIGIVECLRLWARTYTKQGRIGKYSNFDIADHLEWDREPDELINALAACGWIRFDAEYRLVLVRLRWDGGRRHRRWERLKAAGGDISKAVRLFIYSRDNYACRQCSITSDLTLDHIRPIVAGGTNAIDNLQTLCRRCNGAKGGIFNGLV